jgi:hypothetical protein
VQVGVSEIAECLEAHAILRSTTSNAPGAQPSRRMHDATIEIDPRSGMIRLIPKGGKAIDGKPVAHE